MNEEEERRKKYKTTETKVAQSWECTRVPNNDLKFIYPCLNVTGSQMLAEIHTLEANIANTHCAPRRIKK